MPHAARSRGQRHPRPRPQHERELREVVFEVVWDDHDASGQPSDEQCGNVEHRTLEVGRHETRGRDRRVLEQAERRRDRESPRRATDCVRHASGILGAVSAGFRQFWGSFKGGPTGKFQRQFSGLWNAFSEASDISPLGPSVGKHYTYTYRLVGQSTGSLSKNPSRLPFEERFPSRNGPRGNEFDPFEWLQGRNSIPRLPSRERF